MSFFKKNASQEGAAAAVKAPRGKLSLKKIIGMIFALTVLAAAGIFCWKLFFSAEEKQIRTGQTTFGALSASIEGTGATMPYDSVSYTTASNTEILEVCVSAGDTVEVGDLLYRQDDSEIDEEIDEYRDEIAENEDSLTDYYSQLEDLYEEMGNLRVSAPVSGHLQSVQVEQGDTVRVGDILAVLVDDATMKLTQYFSYGYEDQIHLGMAATVSVPDLMRSFTGTVTDIKKVERVTGEGVRTFAVTVTIDNPGALTESMSASGCLITDGGEKIYPSVEGSLEYAATKTLKAEAEGEITTCNAVDYQKVSAGESLFAIDGAAYETQLKNLNTQITRAKEKIATLTERIADSEEKRESFEVRSEIAGTVIMCTVKKGDKPQSGRTAVMVYNLDSMSIQVNIDELDIGYVKNGMEVTIVRSGAETNETYVGTVTEVSLEASNSGGVATFPVTISIPSQGALSAGVSVSYYINTGDTEEGVLAPVNAVQYTDEGTCLFIQSDKRPDNAVDLENADIPEGYYAVPVETGTSNAQYIRILSGVEEGTTLFLGYIRSAPSGGDSTSQRGDSTTIIQGGSVQMIPNAGVGFGGGGGGSMQMRPMG